MTKGNGDDDVLDATSLRAVMIATKLNDVLDKEQVAEIEAMGALVWLLGFSCIPKDCRDPLRRMNKAEEREAYATAKTVHHMLRQIIKDHQEAATEH